MLKLDEDLLRRQVEAEEITQVDQYDTSDDLHGIISDAQDTSTGPAPITSTANETISIYPESNSEDRPLIAVTRGVLTLLGGEWKLREAASVDGTVKAIREAVQEANAQLETLDRQTA